MTECRKTASGYELGQAAGQNLKAMFNGRRDVQTSAIEWYRGFSRGLGGVPLPEVEAFIVEQCRATMTEEPQGKVRAELAILDVLARSPLDFLPGIEDEPIKRRRAHRGSQTNR